MEENTWRNDLSSSKIWWNKRRRKYNYGLIVSGILAFALYIFVVEFIVLKSEKNWDGELTLFSFAFQMIGFIVLVGIANLFYNLGAFSERLVKPKNIEQYRRRIFSIGYWYSCLLPLIVPLSLLADYL